MTIQEPRGLTCLISSAMLGLGLGFVIGSLGGGVD